MNEVAARHEGAIAGELVLGIDTCGPEGSVALARLGADGILSLLGQHALAGKTYSTTMMTALRELLAGAGATLRDVGSIVVTSGPGSFTGVRIGLSAAKGLAEPGSTHIVAVSRLEVLAHKAGADAAALDAHRGEVFLRAGDEERLAGAEDLATWPVPARVAVCDDAAAMLIGQVWSTAQLVRVDPPTAADAIAFALPRIDKAQFDDPVTLDGNYLRRSDAEIFGSASNQP